MSVGSTKHSRGVASALMSPERSSIPSPACAKEELQTFHAHALEMAHGFRSFYKDSTGTEPRPEMLLAPAQERLISEWLSGPEGSRAIERIADRVLAFLSTSIGHGHPGHDTRHVLYKDPIAGLRFALEEDLSPCRQLFIIPSLLHDIGRLYEAELFSKPQSGALGVDHAALGFLVTHHLLGDDLRTDGEDPELSLALANLRNEILNAVLDHQTGHSRTSFFAQAVQRADREQLVGYEMLHRSFSFDLGFHGLRIRGSKMPERSHTLPLPGHAADDHLFHHIEFYMRNLTPNIGREGERHIDKGKVESGRFLWLASSPEMRAQIFAPEMARDEGRSVSEGRYKRALEPRVWREIVSFPSSQLSAELAEFRGVRSLRQLAEEFVHPPHATRCDLPHYDNWRRIDTALSLLDPAEKRRMGEALSYALRLAADVEREDGAVISAAMSRFGGAPSSALGKVALLVHGLHADRDGAFRL